MRITALVFFAAVFALATMIIGGIGTRTRTQTITTTRTVERIVYRRAQFSGYLDGLTRYLEPAHPSVSQAECSQYAGAVCVQFVARSHRWLIIAVFDPKLLQNPATRNLIPGTNQPLP